jgi:hypothetical protein
MSDYSIELASERIVDSKSKRYFAEVFGCYSAGYFRSAVVMLWSVVVTDVLLKLEQLASAYADATAQAILTEIENMRSRNEKSPEWEAELMKLVVARTDLLDQAEFSHIQALQSHRHLSAHPVITSSDALFSPNKETARAHIRNALESVLTKPPIMSRRIFDTFIEDVEAVTDALALNPEDLLKYLQSKYFRYFSPATFQHIFKSLWRVTFKSTDSRSEANRAANLEVLKLTYSKQRAQLGALISAERDWFSDVTFNESTLKVMTSFFREYHEVFKALTDAVRTPIEAFANQSLDNYASCWFMGDSPESHMAEVMKRVVNGEMLSGDVFSLLSSSLEDTDAIRDLYKIGIIAYFCSSSYDTANIRFRDMIEPFLQAYLKDEFEEFLQQFEACTNSQVLHRRRASPDHQSLRDSLVARFPGIDLTRYPSFQRSL